MTSLTRLFHRYVQHHLDVSLPGRALTGPDGVVIGYAERIRLHGQQIEVTGWAQADDVTLTVDGAEACVAPSILRPDVNAALDRPPAETFGFVASVPLQAGPIWLTLRVAKARFGAELCDITLASLRRHRRALLPRFLRDLAGASPWALRWMLFRNLSARAQVKRRLGFNVGPERQTPCDDLFAKQVSPAPTGGRVTIILPVYNALDLLPEALDRVVKHTDLKWRLIVVEDCSSDPKVRPFLRAWRKGLLPQIAARVDLFENAKNLGFIGSVNKALRVAIDYGDPVVLLNSDAMVPAGWASRLLSPFATDPQIASVTPMSNDAEIFTIPAICRRMDLQPGDVDHIDQTAKRLHPVSTLAAAPTGVGFCMAMRIDFLRQIPKLDPAFGRGYGEEVDWCQRARALGGKHVVTPTVFVEHKGGASFGSADKQALIKANNAIIAGRYPSYDEEVQSFIQSDPIAPSRLALAIALVARQQMGAVPIYLGHAMGGGAEDDLKRRVARDLTLDLAVIVLRVGGAHPWGIEMHGPWGVVQAPVQTFEDVQNLLAPLTKREVLYSCAVGAARPDLIPGQLMDLAQGGEVRALVHDFFMISPSYTLLNSAKVFDGVPTPDSTDPAHQFSQVPLGTWQQAWSAFLDRCDEVEVFSTSSAQIMTQAYPGITRKIRHRPHRLITPVGRVAARRGPRVIGVLGNIGHQKGAAVVSQLSHDLAKSGAASLAVIGHLDPFYAVHPSTRIHGSYDRQDIPGLARDYGITDWLIPSIWPETFSFTTHEALATGLPVWVFDLGAQAEAVSAAPNGGGVIPLGPPQAAASAIVKHITRTTGTEAA